LLYILINLNPRVHRVGEPNKFYLKYLFKRPSNALP